MSYDRDLVRSIAEPVVLRLVAERAMYGYEIIKIVNERTGGAFEWKEGTLYPCLHRLEGAGLIQGDWQGPEEGRQRKYYRITRKGRARLKEKSTEWASFAESVNLLLFSPLPV